MIMTHTVVYVSCAQSREIQVFSLANDSGEIRLRQRVPTAGAPSPMKVRPDRRVLYAGTRSDDAILAFAIDSSSGELALLGSSPSPGSPTYVACDQANRLVFCASYGGNLLAVFPLDAQGAPLPAAQIQTDLPRAHAALVDAGNQWLLVPQLGADAIGSYRIGDDARITPNTPALTPVGAGSGPRHLVYSPNNRQVFCLNELDGSIDRFDFDAAAGTLAHQQSVSILPPGFSGKPWAAELRATPDGRFLYATDRTASVIAALDTGSGELTLIDHYPTETQPRGMAIDPTGCWLIAAGQLSCRMTVYAIDPATGRLCERQSHPTGADPICVEMAALAG
jgi:6-phosphogluconolactonase